MAQSSVEPAFASAKTSATSPCGNSVVNLVCGRRHSNISRVDPAWRVGNSVAAAEAVQKLGFPNSHVRRPLINPSVSSPLSLMLVVALLRVACACAYAAACVIYLVVVLLFSHGPKSTLFVSSCVPFFLHLSLTDDVLQLVSVSVTFVPCVFSVFVRRVSFSVFVCVCICCLFVLKTHVMLLLFCFMCYHSCRARSVHRLFPKDHAVSPPHAL